MSKISEKELSGLNEALNEEELLVKKFQMLAGHTQDKEIKDKFNEIAKKHQGHFDELYKQLG
jgi:rubrerythrin